LPVNAEADLIAAAQAGDRDAFGVLVERYQDRLFAAMLGLVGSPDEAEEAAQDAFVRAFLKLHTFHQNSQFFTWLYRIAFNSALSRQRRRRPTVGFDAGGDGPAIPEPVDPREGPEAGLARADHAVLVRHALSLLTEDHRAILVLREMQECSYEQIAEVLQMPIGTVRSRIARARVKLRELVEQLEDGRLRVGAG
jgi:RNA polymerase sigma-70 factor (ECF subfamily)